MKNAKIVFFGTSAFGVPTLESLIKKGFDVSLVVTTPDEPAGRNHVLTPPPIKTSAQGLHLPIIQPDRLKDNDKIFDELSSSGRPNLGIVASYGKIIPANIINFFDLGILNIHPSLLPKYRGPSPLQTQLLYGETDGGVTIIKIDEHVDHGPILASSGFSIPQFPSDGFENFDFHKLHDMAAEVGAALLIKLLPDYISGKIKPKEQDHEMATFTKRIKKEDGKIDWKKSAEQICNQYRAYRQWPGIWTTWKDRALKLTLIDFTRSCQNDDIAFGTVFRDNGKILVRTGDGSIELRRVHLEGGKELTIGDFLSGHPDLIGSKFN